MWSKELQELSEQYFEYDGTHVKHQTGIFGILSVNSERSLYTIMVKPDLLSKYNYKSALEAINAGWAVD